MLMATAVVGAGPPSLFVAEPLVEDVVFAPMIAFRILVEAGYKSMAPSIFCVSSRVVMV